MQYIKSYNEHQKQVPPKGPKKVINSSELTNLLNTIGKDPKFIEYANKYGRKDYIVDVFDCHHLTQGFCNPLAYYIKDRYEGISVYSAKNEENGNHLFIKFQDKYYDGLNTEGVDNPIDLDFFTSKSDITIKLLEE